ncbi:hypothetical protein [Erwinia tracheiphila]|nr:hypothetical protein [Erwinia tracheiphila]
MKIYHGKILRYIKAITELNKKLADAWLVVGVFKIVSVIVK